MPKSVFLLDRIALCLSLAVLLPACSQALAQSQDVRAAKERAGTGDYDAAILLYRSAINEAANDQTKQTLQDELDEVTREYYAELYEQARTASSREERIRTLQKAHSLDLRGWIFTEFEQIVFKVRTLTDEIFRELEQEAHAAIQSRDYARALSQYEQARALDPGRFDEVELAAKYQKLREQILTGEQLAAHGERLLRQGRYEDARETFQQAEEAYPGQTAVEAGLKRVESSLLLSKGRTHTEANRLWTAEAFYRRAVNADPENSEVRQHLEQLEGYRRHVHQGRLLYRDGQCAESQEEFLRAREISATWFRRNRLEPVLTGDCSQRLPLPAGEIREALLILFEGRPQEAIQVLESLSAQTGDSHVQVPAFLGAAYCYVAFLNPATDSSALDKARNQFRIVLKLQPNYQLPETIFSPRVREVLDDLR